MPNESVQWIKVKSSITRILFVYFTPIFCSYVFFEFECMYLSCTVYNAHFVYNVQITKHRTSTIILVCLFVVVADDTVEFFRVCCCYVCFHFFRCSLVDFFRCCVYSLFNYKQWKNPLEPNYALVFF